MKKVLVSLMTVIMIALMCVSAFAKNGAFVKSPSTNQAPVIDKVENKTDDCKAELEVTPFKDRDKLPENKKQELDKIYDDVKNDGDIIKEGFKEVAKKNDKVKEKDLAVSDVFDISYHNCDEHDGHEGFTVQLSADSLKNFVSLMYYNNGKWEVVPDAKVNADGTSISFTMAADVQGSFAVVVDSSTLPSDTSDNSNIALWVMILSASALAIVLVALNKKRA